MPVTENSNEDLCKSCGACCDGTLFYQVKLEPDENLLSVMEQGPDKDKKGFKQPCPYFNTVCTIYDRRPVSCRTFNCTLLEDLNAGLLTNAEATESVLRLKAAKKVLIVEVPEAAETVSAAEQAIMNGFRNYPDMIAFQTENKPKFAALKALKEALAPFTTSRRQSIED